MANLDETGVDVLMARWADGDDTALEEISRLTYPRLRARAENILAGGYQVLDPEDLIAEAYLLLGKVPPKPDIGYFLAVMTQKMKWIYLDTRKRTGRKRRGGGDPVLSIDAALCSDGGEG